MQKMAKDCIKYLSFYQKINFHQDLDNISVKTLDFFNLND